MPSQSRLVRLSGDCEVVAPDIVNDYAEMPERRHGRETWQQGFELMTSKAHLEVSTRS
jgi:hypothetical protein